MTLPQALLIVWLAPVPFVFGFFVWVDWKARSQNDGELKVDVNLPIFVNSEAAVWVWYALMALMWPLLLPGISVKR